MAILHCITVIISLREVLLKRDDCGAASFMLRAALIVPARWPISPRAPTRCQDNARKKSPSSKSSSHIWTRRRRRPPIPQKIRCIQATISLSALQQLPNTWPEIAKTLTCGTRKKNNNPWLSFAGMQGRIQNLFLILVKSVTGVLFWCCSCVIMEPFGKY